MKPYAIALMLLLPLAGANAQPPATEFNDDWPVGARIDVSDDGTVFAALWPTPAGTHCVAFDVANVANVPGIVLRLRDAIATRDPALPFVDWVRVAWDTVFEPRPVEDGSAAQHLCRRLRASFVVVP